MKNKNRLLNFASLVITALVCQWSSFGVQAAPAPKCLLLLADRLFDGVNSPKNDMAVLIEGDKITSIGPSLHLSGKCGKCDNKLYLGDAALLPGFIESHAHISFQNVRKDKVLEHGITTVQDTGGPLKAPEGGVGKLRLLSTGPILQAPGGYPLNVFGGEGGYDKVGYPLTSVAQAQAAVQHLYDGGATAVKIALESGGETGAPWMQPHGTHAVPKTPWPMLSLPVAKAIVDKAQEYGMRIIAHAGENMGFKRALDAGVDEFAHIPCARISESLLKRAVKQGVTFVTTIDTLSSCVDAHTHTGIHANVISLANKHAKFIYGSEIGHDNVPWGINAEELHMMLHLTSGATVESSDVVNVLKAATSKAGERLGVDSQLGRIEIGAPADIIAVRGNPFEKFKLLEYPDLVMSGGKMVVNKFH